MNKSISKIILSLMIIFFLTLSFSCSNPSSDNSTESGSTNTQSPSQPNPTSPPSPNNPPAPTPAPEIYYTISFNKNNETATGSTASIKAKADSIVTLTANGFALEGYTFTGWNTKADGTGTGYGDASSLKLTGDMTLYAQWISTAAPTYQISIPAVVGGTVSVNKTVAEAGSEIELTIIPDDLYEVDECVVTDSENNSIQVTKNQSNNYTFIMPGKNVNVNTIFKRFAYKVSAESYYTRSSFKKKSTENANQIDLPFIVTYPYGPGYKVEQHYACPGDEIFVTVYSHSSSLSENYYIDNIIVRDHDNQNKVLSEYNSVDKSIFSFSFTMPEHDIFIDVTRKNIKCTITFETNCSTEIQPMIVDKGMRISLDPPNASEAECSEFEYWYHYWNHEFKFCTYKDFSTIDDTLYAKWKNITVTKDNMNQRLPNLHTGTWTLKLTGTFDKDSVSQLISLLPKDAMFNLDFSSATFASDMEIEIHSSLINSINLPNGSGIKSISLSDCTKIKEFIVPEGVTILGSFEKCSSLTSVEIPNTVKSIGGFKNCNKLCNINIPNGITSLGDYCFYGCPIAELVLPNSITSLGDYCFAGCSFTELDLPDSITSVGDYCFARSKLEKLEIPKIEQLNSTILENCSSLKKLIIPDTVTSIEKEALADCINLEELTIPFVGGNVNPIENDESVCFGYIFEDVTNYYNNSFPPYEKQWTGGDRYDNSSYIECDIPASLKKIKITGGKINTGAFYFEEAGNFSPDEIIIGENVSIIYNEAFFIWKEDMENSNLLLQKLIFEHQQWICKWSDEDDPSRQFIVYNTSKYGDDYYIITQLKYRGRMFIRK